MELSQPYGCFLSGGHVIVARGKMFLFDLNGRREEDKIFQSPGNYFEFKPLVDLPQPGQPQILQIHQIPDVHQVWIIE